MRNHRFVRSAVALNATILATIGALSVAGCLAETGEREPYEDPTGAENVPDRGAAEHVPDVNEPENVESLQEALIACTDSHWHGGDLFPGTYDTTLGCDSCGFMRERTTFSVWNESHGSCAALGWASSDPRDCRVRVRINRSGGFQNGTCRAQVEAEQVVCPHNKCTTGARLRRACPDPCIAQICAVDPFCCNNTWDSICVGEVATVCGQSC